MVSTKTTKAAQDLVTSSLSSKNPKDEEHIAIEFEHHTMIYDKQGLISTDMSQYLNEVAVRGDV